jgi:hypothetical protein
MRRTNLLGKENLSAGQFVEELSCISSHRKEFEKSKKMKAFQPCPVYLLSLVLSCLVHFNWNDLRSFSGEFLREGECVGRGLIDLLIGNWNCILIFILLCFSENIKKKFQLHFWLVQSVDFLAPRFQLCLLVLFCCARAFWTIKYSARWNAIRIYYGISAMSFVGLLLCSKPFFPAQKLGIEQNSHSPAMPSANTFPHFHKSW